jgi:hypothetical protein
MYQDKSKKYFSNPRLDLITLISIHSIFKLERAPRKKRIFNRLTFGLLSDLLTAQYVIVAGKSSNIYQKLL